MNRLSRYLLGVFAALLIAAAQAFCADLLLDGFTDPAASHGKWVNKGESFMSHTVAGGSCTLNNSSATYAGEYYHDFGTNKPATFTLSFVFKSVTGKDAGAFFCRQAGSTFSGYLLTLMGNDVIVWKLANNSSVSIFSKMVGYDLKPTDNKLTVSKSGATFNVFVNDFFAGNFSDNTYNSGDLSLFVDPNTKAVFGTVQVTDVFTQGSPRTSFFDKFDDNSLKYWNFLNNGSPSKNVANGVLTVNTKSSANDALWMYIDFEHTNFTAKVETSHKSGSKSSAYGFILVGESASGQNIVPMAHFAIAGDRVYTILIPGTTTDTPFKANQAILGAASGGLFFVDTIELRKSSTQSSYEFLANGTLLDTYSAANIGFKVIGVGIFCYDNLEITFDNFSLLKEGTTSINRDPKQISRAPASAITGRPAFYDMRGRKRYTTTSASYRPQTRAAGIYVNQNGRDVVVRKGKVNSDQ